MNSVNKTLYIPLYGKAYVSERGLFLSDRKAEQIWAAEGFSLRGKAKSKWLAFYMGIRAAVFDEWVRQKLEQEPDAVVLHIGCGMDSRALRTGTKGHRWYDVDFPEVIGERKRYYSETDDYRMIPGDVRERDWLAAIPESKSAVVVMEGVSMYLTRGERNAFMENLCGHFGRIVLLMDCYTSLAARVSKYRNPINDVGVTEVFGVDHPEEMQQGGLVYLREHEMMPRKYTGQLHGMQRYLFRKLYAGSVSQRLYRLFEYQKTQ